MQSSGSQIIEKVITTLCKGAGLCSGVLIVIMMLTIVADVSGRFFLNRPLLGGVEFNRTLLVIVVFFGTAYTQFRDGHIRMDLLLIRLSERSRLVLEFGSLLLALLVYGYITYATIPVTIQSIRIAEFETGLIAFPMWPARLLMSIGMLFFTFQIAVDTRAKLMSLRISNSSRQKS